MTPIVPSLTDVVTIVINAVGIYAVIIVCTRIAGLRSFSKISSFDFAMTVAIGSIVGTAATTSDLSLGLAVVSVGVIYILQMAISALRRFEWVSDLVDNEPILLVHDGEILEENLSRSEVTLDDVRANLRKANALNVEEVEAVVFETTGDVSVLHSEDSDADVDDWLLADVGSPEETTSRAEAE